MENQNQKDRLERQMKFILEMDKSKLIGRQTYLSDASRKENDAEHAWHLALMCILLEEYANESIDLLKTMSMVLIHDLIEIDAGDTYAYDVAGNETKEERERQAADRIFALLPEDQGKKLRDLWEEFDAISTPEAKFANTLDKLQPAMLNDATAGIAWKEHGVHLSQILNRNARTSEGSQILWDYSKKHYIDPNVENGSIIRDNETES